MADREPTQLTLSFSIGRPVRGANALVTRDDGNTVLPTTDADWDDWVAAGGIRNFAGNDGILDGVERTFCQRSGQNLGDRSVRRRLVVGAPGGGHHEDHHHQ